MGLASHLGPWRLGTVLNTTGTTAGTIRNMGATIVAQTKAITFADSTSTQAFVLPAGALITNMQVIVSNVGSTDAIVTYTVGGTSLTTGTGVLVIAYMVRLSDGTYNPTAQTA